MSRKGAPTFNSLLDKCVLWATLQDSAGVSGGIDEFPIIPSGVTVTNNGTFTKTNLGNNKSVLNFDGSTNYISLTDNDAWDFGSGDFAIACWVYLPSSDSSGPTIFSQSNATNYQPIYLGVITSKLYIQGSYTGSAWSITGTYGNTTLSTLTWYHVVLIRTGGYITAYLNGIVDGINFNVGSNTLFACSGTLNIGYCRSGTEAMALSCLKDLMIWKGRALTLPEIKLLMNRTHPITGAGLMLAGSDYWRTS